MIEMLFLLLEDLRLSNSFLLDGGKGGVIWLLHPVPSICALVVPSWEVLFLDEGLLLVYYPLCPAICFLVPSFSALLLDKWQLIIESHSFLLFLATFCRPYICHVGRSGIE